MVMDWTGAHIAVHRLRKSDKVETMTNEELAVKIQRGEDVQESLEALYLQNIGIIKKIVKKYAGVEDPEDLMQEAFFAIRKAALLWSPAAGAGFAHYAGFWIKQILLRYIDNCGGVVRVPVNQRARIQRYHRTVNRFRVCLGRDPEPMELCFALDISADQLESLQQDIHALRIRSTSEIIGEDDGITLEDTLQAAGDPIGDVVDRIQAEELQRVLWGVVDELKGRQADVIRERYRDGLTLKECGDLHGISTERIRQIENNALRAMRTGHNRRVLIPFFTESGAYAAGLRSISLAAFKRSHVSSQERAVMYLEERLNWHNLQGAVIQV